MYPHQDPHNQSFRQPGQNPWIATGAAAVVSALIAAVLITSSGDAKSDSTLPMGAPSGMPTMPTMPSDFPTGGMPTGPDDMPPMPSGAPTTAGPSTPKNDWNVAAKDDSPFNSAEWFPDTGDFSIQ
ncbi:MAG: hypothetical protein HOV68_24415, partial [Streptomycetaceae bacterium]|nr:hypothetical protein [Streptomycetaceae bacterium]